jgi:hypothetical protein
MLPTRSVWTLDVIRGRPQRQVEPYPLRNEVRRKQLQYVKSSEPSGALRRIMPSGNTSRALAPGTVCPIPGSLEPHSGLSVPNSVSVPSDNYSASLRPKLAKSSSPQVSLPGKNFVSHAQLAAAKQRSDQEACISRAELTSYGKRPRESS